jgi:hypothetical protein
MILLTRRWSRCKSAISGRVLLNISVFNWNGTRGSQIFN